MCTAVDWHIRSAPRRIHAKSQTQVDTTHHRTPPMMHHTTPHHYTPYLIHKSTPPPIRHTAPHPLYFPHTLSHPWSRPHPFSSSTHHLWHIFDASPHFWNSSVPLSSTLPTLKGSHQYLEHCLFFWFSHVLSFHLKYPVGHQCITEKVYPIYVLHLRTFL